MPLEVTDILESDMDRLMEIQFAAFENDPYHEALYPGGNTPEARKMAGQRVIEEWRGTPEQRFLKCTDTETGVIMGFGRWNLYEKERLKEAWAKREDIDWCEGRLKEIAANFLGATMEMREKMWEGRPHCCRFDFLGWAYLSTVL
jgi:hypothetical protein